MKRVLAATAITGFLSLGIAAQAFAATPPGATPGNPSGTGQPSFTCPVTPPGEPGNAPSSPGSPFNEVTPGTGGQNYAGNGPATAGNTNLANGRGVAAQYDVACYHQPA